MLAPIRPSPIIPSCIADSLIGKSLTWQTDEVPQTKNRLIATVVFKAEHAHAGGFADSSKNASSPAIVRPLVVVLRSRHRSLR
jgi:hypothetical protein